MTPQAEPTDNDLLAVALKRISELEDALWPFARTATTDTVQKADGTLTVSNGTKMFCLAPVYFSNAFECFKEKEPRP